MPGMDPIRGVRKYLCYYYEMQASDSSLPSRTTRLGCRHLGAEGQLMLFTMSGVVSRRPNKWRHQVSDFQGDGKENFATELR